MSDSKVISILNGSDPSPAARLLRVATALAEPAYAAAMRARNAAFDRGWKRSIDLGRPTISIGNLTTGGTGKTPVVRWLADRLRADGLRPAVLIRGYHANATGSDEQRELDRALNRDTSPGTIWIEANPSRVEGAAAVLAKKSTVDVFLLDDGFQHRTAARQFDLVLISATSPFGFGHVLPRGLLREPLSGLARASAVLITHQDQVAPAELDEIQSTIKKHTAVPIFRASHRLTGLTRPATGECRVVDSLAEGSPFAVAGIGDPAAFGRGLARHAGRPLPHRWFADHHAYGVDDWREIVAEAARNGCDRVVTTEKDWSKLAAVVDERIPVDVAQLAIQFVGDDGDQLYATMRATVGRSQRKMPASTVS